MDAVISFGQMAAVLKSYGPFGILVVIWYFDMRHARKAASDYREDMARALAEHKEHMAEIRRMYENNVILVENHEKLSADLKDIIIMNTQALTHLVRDIEQNQFCPAQRVNKQSMATVRS